MAELAEWESFYLIVGSAAGALIGLQFVVLTLIAERPPLRAADAGAAFMTPTIVHFGSAYAVGRAPARPVANDHPYRRTLGPRRNLWSNVRVNRRTPYARAIHIPARFRGPTLPRFAAADGVRDPRVRGIGGSLAHARGAVWRRGGSAPVAFYRNPQCLGWCVVSRPGQQTR